MRDIHVVVLRGTCAMFITCNAGCFVELFKLYIMLKNTSVFGNYKLPKHTPTHGLQYNTQIIYLECLKDLGMGH